MMGSRGEWNILRELLWHDVLLVFGVFFLSRIVIFVVQSLIAGLAERVPARNRLFILRTVPFAKILIGIATASIIVPMLIEPTFRNLATLLASVGLALAFTLKDYGSSLAAGITTVLENTYQPGDWIQIDGAYGEVKHIGPRATRIVTADDTEVIIPHTRLWSTSIFNATSGNRSLLCVTDFYLHPDHDAAAARKCLEEIAATSSYRKPESTVTVIALEKPWGTHYRLKAYVKESREQFLFITDLTVRGKAALLSLGMRFAQAAFAETKTS
ncbi:MAG: mechanosensitive ion channel family protein [Elusimicrobiota bacterium]